ncbi:hypothetical protein [Microbacterium sp. VKM Ac-2923]|uniref:hypothetical protein n=1 Tax=Microbacterium sp. VKM Ac-2923 TaxID=2929476 RepID=UPI001FB38C52|nr:hypothetical protein [Microbacterium sp. VKM Ac-2923]MCJ1708029.1 hypothetical protein [Microbacterium sp. VKM Ac-2923]
MTHSTAAESLFFGPLTLDWTIAEMLAWIGAEDARCHDERLAGILDAVRRALDPGAAPVTGRVVGLVRTVAMRVSAQPGSGERRVGEVVGAPAGSVRDAGALVAV